jgi:ferredoxin
MITVVSGIEVRNIPSVGTLLESLEKSSVQIESHCRDGFCGACKVKLKSGRVTEVKQSLGYFDDGEILACCSRPETQIEIEVL